MTDRLGHRRSIARPLPPKQAPFSKRAYQSSAAEPLSQVWSRSQKDAAGERLDARGGSAGAIGRDSRFVISFPVVNDAIRNAIASIQHAVGRQRPSLIACSVDPASLHVPLAELEIESPASTSTARGALQEFHLLLPFLLPQTTNLRFDGLFVHGDEPHSDDVWRGTAGGPATKALGDMNAVKAALPL